MLSEPTQAPATFLEGGNGHLVGSPKHPHRAPESRLAFMLLSHLLKGRLPPFSAANSVSMSYFL